MIATQLSKTELKAMNQDSHKDTGKEILTLYLGQPKCVNLFFRLVTSFDKIETILSGIVASICKYQISLRNFYRLALHFLKMTQCCVLRHDNWMHFAIGHIVLFH